MSDAQKVIQQYNELKSIKADCIAALKEKEVEAPDTMTFSELPTYIQKIGA